MLDPIQFATPLTPDAPCGRNREYEEDFIEFDLVQRGRPEQVMGNAVRPAEEPNWSDVCGRARKLLDRTRDLRVVVPLITGLLRTEGFVGLARGLRLLRVLIETQWAFVHPQPDAGDDDDPTLRLNVLRSLVTVGGLRKVIGETPIVTSRQLGRFGMRNVTAAARSNGGMPASERAVIDAAFQDAKIEELVDTESNVAEAFAEAETINALLVDKTGDRTVSLKELVGDLLAIRELLRTKLALRGVGEAPAPTQPDTAPAPLPDAASNLGSSAVNSREDVIKQLDRLCDYYRVHEPSSPVPLLLQRARRLVAMNFLDIIRDLTPSGLPEAEIIGGVEKKS
jgi:type VI secretion system protein ImpA